ncbi:DNA-binding NarL/FixJ family response regulator [Actinoplanes octamycinicus]|uniref:DNA-binding NarL/FixJ family response regulator n=1 Tax=Actinoplanes octamycinicus TaxID=135948 RepID=A0A7W7GTH8_9ACTN|nr:response regulator transcription factor [Actinoplanes octamycinicus]MBB4737966.1 DNA-binding NarL/FixJ family response regulator [Actinoplanes octamycinicus]GIE58983.1 DNA-binding response regulator [Actinoplanes octamycinicus]
MSIRIVVADDQELVRGAFAMILDNEPDMTVVAEAADGAEAVAAVREHAPNVLVLDIRMPGMDGIEATRRLRDEPVRVLMLTTFGQDDYVYDALRAGASGFLLKDVRRAELVHAVRVVAAGESLLAPAVTTRLIETAVRRQPAPATAGWTGLDRLTPREHEALRLLGRGLTNAEMAATLVVSEHTVKTHVSSVLAKLGLRDRAQAVVAAYESGLVVAGEPSPSAE